MQDIGPVPVVICIHKIVTFKECYLNVMHWFVLYARGLGLVLRAEYLDLSVRI